MRLPPALKIHSGCALASSESRLTISGSTHSPNCMPRPVTWSMSGCRPCGQTSGETVQSPRLLVSSRRPENHPSSSTKRSTPTRAARSANAVSTARSCLK